MVRKSVCETRIEAFSPPVFSYLLFRYGNQVTAMSGILFGVFPERNMEIATTCSSTRRFFT
jgi:hypothetical protein